MAATAAVKRFESGPTGVRLEYPSGWFILEKPLPDYTYPVQVFGASNYRIDVPRSRKLVWDPDANEENYPRVTKLAADGAFVWMYRFDIPDGPTKYGSHATTLSYDDAELVTWPGDARWPNAVQRELGFEHGRHRFTIWIWEGLEASDRTLADLRELLASIRV